ncbi:MAG TPA: STAS domain-containing protein [Spirochaetota bacterium]|nr:STAS domain-containing protein [Spirochaetota bacterium]HOH37848.1 STAS domain-containing protein [Spirochaetota bacterium]HPW52540.1 STAS domain-containing protein [Spirochaetota bacterium]
MQIDIVSLSPADSISDSAAVYKIVMPKDVDYAVSREVWLVLKTIIDGGAKYLYADFKENEEIDSSGLSMLIRLANLVKEKKGKVAVANLSQKNQRLLSMVNVPESISVFSSETDLLDSFR